MQIERELTDPVPIERFANRHRQGVDRAALEAVAGDDRVTSHGIAGIGVVSTLTATFLSGSPW